MTDRELMQQALEALEWNLPVIEDYGDHEQLNRQHRAIIALRERLAQPEQEPVAWRNKETGEFCTGGFLRKDWARWTPLYTTPPRREWVGLTEEEVKRVYFVTRTDFMDYARALEAKLKEKNT